MSSPPSLTVTAHLTLLTLLAATTTYFFYKSRRLRLLKLHSQNPNNNQINTANLYPPRRGKLFYISQTGTSKTLAQRLFNLLTVNNIPFDLIDPKDYEPEDLHKETLVLIVASTWDDGNAPPSGGFFANWLAESAEDFRVGSLLLRECKFAVFGVGSKSYGETFNAVAKEFSKRMRALGGAEVLPVCEGDVDGGQLNEVFAVWSRNVVGVLKGGLEGNGGYFGNVSDSEIVDELDEYDDDEEEEENGEESEIVDLEDIAGRGPSRKFELVKKVNGKLNDEKEMVTPVIRASLVKQVIVSARKPEFFQMSHPLYEVVTEEGLMRPCFKARPGGVYSGGSAQMIEKSLNIHGDEILYVGDHIYTDVSQSKVHLRWRTALICRELEEEYNALIHSQKQRSTLIELINQKEVVGDLFNQLRLALQRRSTGRPAQTLAATHMEDKELTESIQKLLIVMQRLDEKIAPLLEIDGEHFNRRWGFLSRAGLWDKSHLMRQVEKYADIYTSRVSNFLHYTPFMYFRSQEQTLAHDSYSFYHPQLAKDQ